MIKNGKLEITIQTKQSKIGGIVGDITDEPFINGEKGYYIEKSFPDGEVIGQELIWETGELVVEIETLSSCILTKEELVKVAESMK